MKCPKCAYLGFETGDRCKHCGYDFSLLSAPESDAPDFADLSLHPEGEFDHHDPWLDDRHDPLGGQHGPEPSTRDNIDDVFTISLTPESPLAEDPIIRLTPDFDDESEPARLLMPTTPAPAAPMMQFVPTGSAEAALPLFAPSDEDDDEPLIKMPATPRPPLAVRRTPDTPRLRAVPRAASRPALAPVLQFSEEPVEEAPVEEAEERVADDSSRPGARLIAVAIDHAILLGIDLAIVYFTVRMAGLSMSEWRVLPLAPMLTFLALLKLAYFYAFTAVGGQTIGKMAVGTCVIADDGGAVDAARAMRRT
jgi:hypothetical protein